MVLITIAQVAVSARSRHLYGPRWCLVKGRGAKASLAPQPVTRSLGRAFTETTTTATHNTTQQTRPQQARHKQQIQNQQQRSTWGLGTLSFHKQPSPHPRARTQPHSRPQKIPNTLSLQMLLAHPTLPERGGGGTNAVASERERERRVCLLFNLPTSFTLRSRCCAMGCETPPSQPAACRC